MIEKLTVKDRLDELQDITEKLLGVLKEREIGLSSWWMMTGSLMREMKKALDHSGV